MPRAMVLVTAGAMALSACNGLLGIDDRAARGSTAVGGGTGAASATTSASVGASSAGGAAGQGGAPATGGGLASGGAGGQGGQGGVLSCHAGFTFSPVAPSASESLYVTFTDDTPWSYLELELAGPGSPTVVNMQVNQFPVGTWNWEHEVSGHAPGVLTMVFRRDVDSVPVVLGTCEVEVLP